MLQSSCAAPAAKLVLWHSVNWSWSPEILAVEAQERQVGAGDLIEWNGLKPTATPVITGLMPTTWVMKQPGL